MIEKFLKVKHWQIFMVTFGLSFLIQIIMIPITLMGDYTMFVMKVFPIIMIIFISGLMGWIWCVGVGLQNKVPSDVTMKVKKFKTLLIIPLIYMLLFSVSMGSMFSGANVGFVVLLHFFSMFCIFYCLYFVAKTFKTVELQREASFSDFAGEFFMIWFFPIGIWIVQPKVNKMIED